MVWGGGISPHARVRQAGVASRRNQAWFSCHCIIVRQEFVENAELDQDPLLDRHQPTVMAFSAPGLYYESPWKNPC